MNFGIWRRYNRRRKWISFGIRFIWRRKWISSGIRNAKTLTYVHSLFLCCSHLLYIWLIWLIWLSLAFILNLYLARAWPNVMTAYWYSLILLLKLIFLPLLCLRLIFRGIWSGNLRFDLIWLPKRRDFLNTHLFFFLLFFGRINSFWIDPWRNDILFFSLFDILQKLLDINRRCIWLLPKRWLSEVG